MKMGRYVFWVGLFAVVTGCATTSATNQALNAESGADSIQQKTEFKDLPVEMQQVILQGG